MRGLMKEVAGRLSNGIRRWNMTAYDRLREDHPEWEERICRAIAQNGITAGMNTEQFKMVVTSPTRVLWERDGVYSCGVKLGRIVALYIWKDGKVFYVRRGSYQHPVITPEEYEQKLIEALEICEE